MASSGLISMALRKQRDGLVEPGSIHGKLSQQGVRLRHAGIERERAGQLDGGRFVELHADHELRGVQVRGGRRGADAKGLGE